MHIMRNAYIGLTTESAWVNCPTVKCDTLVCELRKKERKKCCTKSYTIFPISVKILSLGNLVQSVIITTYTRIRPNPQPTA